MRSSYAHGRRDARATDSHSRHGRRRPREALHRPQRRPRAPPPVVVVAAAAAGVAARRWLAFVRARERADDAGGDELSVAAVRRAECDGLRRGAAQAAIASKATGRSSGSRGEGSRVTAGEVIARLDNRDVRAQSESAEANVRAARAALAQRRPRRAMRRSS